MHSTNDCKMQYDFYGCARQAVIRLLIPSLRDEIALQMLTSLAAIFGANCNSEMMPQKPSRVEEKSWKFITKKKGGNWTTGGSSSSIVKLQATTHIFSPHNNCRHTALQLYLCNYVSLKLLLKLKLMLLLLLCSGCICISIWVCVCEAGATKNRTETKLK